MKTVLDSNGVSIHIWHDDGDVSLTADGLHFNGNLEDPSLTDTTATIVENITPPADWYGRKYLLVDGQWVDNPDDPIANPPTT